MDDTSRGARTTSRLDRERIGRGIASAIHGSVVRAQHEGERERRPPGRTFTSHLQVILPVSELQERDRLKHAGGLGEVQTVKVVRNGEGGTKRVWKPATRKPSRLVPEGFRGTDRQRPTVTVTPSPPSTTTDSSAVGQGEETPRQDRRKRATARLRAIGLRAGSLHRGWVADRFPGSELAELGALEGRRTSREDRS
jgi:hypothetical protein